MVFLGPCILVGSTGGCPALCRIALVEAQGWAGSGATVPGPVERLGVGQQWLACALVVGTFISGGCTLRFGQYYVIAKCLAASCLATTYCVRSCCEEEVAAEAIVGSRPGHYGGGEEGPLKGMVTGDPQKKAFVGNQ